MEKIPVGKSKDLTGQVFDHLTVLFRTTPPENSSQKRAAWWACKCDCGNSELIKIRGDRFKTESNFSCGCSFKKIGRKIDKSIKIGQKYGKWTVIKFEGVINTHASYLCKCDCGNEKIIAGSSLKAKQTCGCSKCTNKSIKDITGQKFEKLTAIKPTDKRQGGSVVWLCKCDCGNFCEVSLNNLKFGNTKSCGCIGKSYGEYHIEQLLNKNNIDYISQFVFKDCVFNDTKYPAKFDFFIQNHYLIEYDGEQHFQFRYNNNYHGWNNKENYIKIHTRDLIKNKFCFDNNIPLIRIPYNVDYNLNDLKLETTRFLLTPENEEKYYNG